MAEVKKKQNNGEYVVGLDVYKAKKRLLTDFSDISENNIDIVYEESYYPRFTVLACEYNEKKGCFILRVASNNPIRHLPSNFQSNDFLRNFLMIFQHIMNDTAMTLDNMHDYFRPMEAPASFLPSLANWLGIHLDTLGGELEIRKFLQYAIPLYRYRGTVLGLKAHLSIIAGIEPEIIEEHRPFTVMQIDTETNIEANFFETDDAANSFTIHFPVLRSTFSDSLLRRISLIVQREKPVHTKAYISFKEAKQKSRKITTMNAESSMDSSGVIFI